MKLAELDLSPFKKAVASLKRAVAKYQTNTSDEYVRDATIQRFEFTYELCGKFLRRYLELSEQNSDEIKEMPFPDLIRLANTRGLLKSDWSVWKVYRDKRNITSHTYDEKKANDIIQVLPGFLEDAEALLAKLEKRI